jgi:hypothetical protein
VDIDRSDSLSGGRVVIVDIDGSDSLSGGRVVMGLVVRGPVVMDPVVMGVALVDMAAFFSLVPVRPARRLQRKLTK